MKAARTLAILGVAPLCASCGQWDLPVEIPFHAAWNGKAIACEGTTPTLTDLRFYVTNPRLVDRDGHEQDVRFATEYEWENDAVAYIDLETGSGACVEGSPEVYDRVIGVARDGQYDGLRFTVGVPFRLNHVDMRTATPPLNRSEMHTQTISGYTFLRAGVAVSGGEFQIRVASAACEGSIGYVTGCEFPGRIEVFLSNFVPGESRVAVNLDVLVAGFDLAGTQTRCEPRGEGDCAAAFAAFGIDPETGQSSTDQRVFSLH